MTRLFPRSLFARLIWLLVPGLVLAQLLSATLLFRERGQVLYHAGGLLSAQRMAEIVRLLEAADTVERGRLVKLFSVPPLDVSLAQKERPPRFSETSGGMAAMFGAALRRHLGAGYRVEVAMAQGRARHHEENDYHLDDEEHEHRGYGRGRWTALEYPGVFDRHGLVYLANVRLRDGSWVSFAQGVPPEVLEGSGRLLVTLGLLILVAVLLSLLAVRWVTRPLSQLAQAADRLGKDIRQPPLPEQGPAEVQRAARAFNAMQSRLVRHIEERTRFLTAVSHDLKTPITRLRLRIESIGDPGLRAGIERDLDEMQAMTGATLDLMRGLDEREALQTVDLPALLESIRDDYQEQGASVSLVSVEPMRHLLRPLAVRRALNNLVDNAVRYGGDAELSLGADGNAVMIRVADRGPGLPEGELEQVFKPFYRVESSRNRSTGGSGLGLAIARDIARAHGGDLVLRNRAGGGLVAEFSLPRSVEQSPAGSAR